MTGRISNAVRTRMDGGGVRKHHDHTAEPYKYELSEYGVAVKSDGRPDIRPADGCQDNDQILQRRPFTGRMVLYGSTPLPYETGSNRG